MECWSEDSCGNSWTGETQQKRKRRGGRPPAESETLERKSTAAF
ncbi:hypothetical protein ABEV54_07465 [Peribacillus psychrosaccharolyticus]